MVNPADKIKLPDGKPFTIQLVGQRGSGKSFLMMKILKKLRKRFKKENRYIISPTCLNLDDTLTNLFDPENIFSNYSDDYIDHVIKTILEEREEADFKWHHRWRKDEELEDGGEWVEIKKRIGAKPPKSIFPEYIIVVDDSIGMFGRNSALALLPTRHRHFRLSMIFASQNFKSTPPLIRNNMMVNIYFRTNNSELKKICQEYNCLETDEEFHKLFRGKTDVPYGFFTINYFKNGKDIYT